MPLAIYLQHNDPALSGLGCEQCMECPSDGNSGKLEIPHNTVGALPCESSVRQKKQRPEQTGVMRFLRALGPGLITGASDDDPSGIGTYAIAGAALGYSALWLAPVTFSPLTAVLFLFAQIWLGAGKRPASGFR